MGTSDIHGLIDWLFKVPDDGEVHDNILPGHRPITLVFSKDKSKEGIKEALFSGRTAVFYNELLIGKKEYINQLVKKSLTIDNIGDLELGYSEDGKSSIKSLRLKNISDAPFLLKNLSEYTFETSSDIINIKPNSTHTLSIKTAGKPFKELNFEVLTAINGTKNKLKLIIHISK